MRWPFPRRHGRSIIERPDRGTVSDTGTGTDTDTGTGTPTDRTTAHRARPSAPGASHATAPPRAAVRNDWARLAPIAAPTTPPVTFDSIGFGRSVSGARSLAAPAPRRHRSEAPIGLLVDIAIVDHTLADEPADHSSDIPSTPADMAPTALRHIERVIDAVEQTDDLMSSDVEWSISSWARPEPLDDDVLHATSWTPESGFVTERTDADQHDSSHMRLVGQRGSFDEAVAPDEPPTDADPTPEKSDVPTLRYVPMPGDRSTHDGPPADLVAVVRAATGVDVGNARIDRSASTTDRAAALGAVAFTQGGVVHLPNELGSIEDPSVRAITAHELTHVAQQRQRGGAPDESSAEGRRLEREAHAVERSVGTIGAVTPTFLRNRTRPTNEHGGMDPRADATTGDTGVQRLAGDDDQFEWQDRPDPRDRQRTARQVLGAFSFVLGRPREVDDEQERASARRFEAEHAQELQARRDERFDEMVEEAERELHLRDLRHDIAEADASELTRADHLDLRRRLDDEMPWEFGPPAGVDPYPGELPPGNERTSGRRRDGTTDDDSDRHDDERHTGHAGHGPAPVRRTATAPDAPTIGANSGSRQGGSLRHRRGGAPTSDDDEPDFGWQDRGTTQNEMANTILGGALGGIFNNLFGDSEATEASDRERAELRALPKLHDKRKQRERALREESLARKRAQAMRSEAPFPVQLDQRDIVAIREALDEEMPLEFNDPDYLSSDVAVSIDQDGEIGDALAGAEPDEQDVADAESDEHDADADADDGSEAAPIATGDAVTDDDDDHDSSAQTWGARLAGAGIVGLRSHRDESDDDAADEPTDAQDGDDAEAASRVLAAASDLDLDQLARRLYGRVRRDLRHELLVDRERAGVLADVH